MSFLIPDKPKQTVRTPPPAPRRDKPVETRASSEQTRVGANRGPSTRAATLLGRAGSPRRNDSFSITHLLGSQSV